MRSGLYLTTVNRYLTDEEAGYIVDNCEAQVLVTSQRLADIAATLPMHAPKCHTWLMVDGTIDGYESYEEAIDGYPAEKLEQEPAGTFMLYSSGTTGRPKGILRALPETTIDADAGPVGALQTVLGHVLAPCRKCPLKLCRSSFAVVGVDHGLPSDVINVGEFFRTASSDTF